MSGNTSSVSSEYSATTNYSVPEGHTDAIKVTVVVDSNGIIESVTATHNASNRESREYQQRFDSGYKSQVVGKKIQDLGSLSRVSGASLTTNAFNDAMKKIKAQI